jgi:NAD(P)-dependent dehydrogenase (short-subunit alcohol dehydrogenase family)
MSKEFSNKVALVTGASRGIGAATSLALARQGMGKIFLHYRSYLQGAEETLAAVREAGSEGELLRADLTTSSGIHDLIHNLQQRKAEVDVLINNAGSLIQRTQLPDFSEDLFDRVMTLNVKSMWFITQAVVPAMLRRSGGVIVNLSSIAGRNGGASGAVLYGAAKAAVAAVTKGLARELAPQGIRVNAISPGTVDNYFHEQFSTPEILAKVVAATPAGRLGTNEEMADAIVFLCSDKSRYIYGQTIELNGGIYMV